MGFGFLALLLPQTSKAHRRAEFQRFGLLLAGDVDGFEKARFGFALCQVLGAGSRLTFCL